MRMDRTYRTSRQLNAAIRREAQRTGRAVTIITHDEHCALVDESGLYEPRCDCRARRLHVRVAMPRR